MVVRTALSMHFWFVVGRVPPLLVVTLCSALFLVLSSLLLVVIVLFLLPLFAWWWRVWLWELMVCMKRAVSPLPVRSMWPMRLPVVWELVTCCPLFCVVCCNAGVVFAFFSASILFGHRHLVVSCSCPQFAHLFIVHGGSDVFMRNICRSGFPTSMSWHGGRTSGN